MSGKNPYMETMEKNLQAMTESMQAVLTANTSVFESFQQTFRKMVEQNTAALAKAGAAAGINPTLADQIREQTEEIKKAMLKDLAEMK